MELVSALVCAPGISVPPGDRAANKGEGGEVRKSLLAPPSGRMRFGHQRFARLLRLPPRSYFGTAQAFHDPCCIS